MVKYWMILLLCINFLIAGAQTSGASQFSKKGIVQSAATISPGFMQHYSQQNIFVSGHLEYYPEEKVSLRGDSYWFVSAVNKPALLKQNSMTMYGALYHFTKNKRADFFMGIQPGVTLTQPNLQDKDGQALKLKVTPLICGIAGFNYYVWDYIHFFCDLRYINSRYFQNVAAPISLNQFIFSGGLGWQIPTQKFVAKK